MHHRPQVIRRPSPQQGRALEIVGHAIEYLIDSYGGSRADSDAGDHEAIKMLMKLSISIFQECNEVVPLRQKIFRLVVGTSFLKHHLGDVLRSY